MRYIILFIFLPLLLSSQELSTTYDSYFQTISDQTSIKIYHAKMVIFISESCVEIKSEVEGVETSLARVEIEWSIGPECMISSYLNRIVFYYPKTNKLVIISDQSESVFYGNIPTIVEMQK